MDKKLEFLLNEKLITQSQYKSLIRLDQGMMKKSGLRNLINYERLMTHLVMTLIRLENCQVVDSMNEEILEQIKAQPSFNDAKFLTQQLCEQLEVKLPQNEIDYLWLHFTGLLNGKEE